MYGLFCKSLDTGIVAVHIDAEWDVLKYKVVQMDYVEERDWDGCLVWDKLQDGYVINDGHLLWCYWNENQERSLGQDLFTGTVVLLSECKEG